jgi:hypothetical protein
VSADSPGLNDHDRFAEAYTAEAETGLINAYYNRPAILVLAGMWRSGNPRCWLRVRPPNGGAARPWRHRDRLRQSGGMLERELALRRLGDDADLQVADLSSPLMALRMNAQACR